MTQNLGTIDRVIRASLAIVIIVLYFLGYISGIAAIILGIFAAVFIITGIVGFCPLYSALKISTKK
jgi:hypothetical protein